MESSALVYAGSGLAGLLAALLPQVLRRRPVSMPMVFLSLGALVFGLVGSLPDPSPVDHREIAERLTEVCVIVALFGAGLALDRPLGLRRWGSTWRLLGITMPLSVVAGALLGWWGFGLGAGLAPAAAVLVAGALAPTDPVLAGDVQVGEPTDAEDSEDEPRFALTSEAGLNDALAFPFVHAAVAMAAAGAAPVLWAGHWLAVDLLWRIAAGVGVGVLVGRVLARLFFTARIRTLRLAERAEGFVAIACTMLAYGVTELVHGYGFLAVFVCATTIRAAERAHGYHGVLHNYIEQFERLLTVAVLVLLGGAMARGLLAPLTAPDVVLAVVLVLVVRPVFGWLALRGGPRGPRDRAVIAFFGVRGVGSLYYLAYAAGQATFGELDRLWATAGLAVLVSVLVHGVTATPVMTWIDRRRSQAALVRGEDPDATAVPV
ncbi:MAG TPA: cation:proton antiporter [Kineosporiaceae bacterium]|nr:cation:proton antiporter [Kineosporiaceae bacterium]